MSKVMFIDQGNPDDNFYGLANEHEGYDMSDLTLEEMGLTVWISQIENFIDEVGPVLGKAVIDVGDFNMMCMMLTELKKRER